MDLSDRKLLYKIVCARDKRYDGRFYCGVRTTGIYCRPICPARPKIENITFYRSSAEAEKAGFRACLRCRPDLAPNSVQWNGTAAVVGRALAMISRSGSDRLSMIQLSDKLGVTDRHLRRLFDEHVGASPIEVANSKRLHLAKQLLAHSKLSVTEVAFASGYQSIRRFNEAFKERFQANPSLIRRSTGISHDLPLFQKLLRSSSSHQDANFIRIELPVIEPFDWDHVFGFLKNHGVRGVESFDGNRYRRSFVFDQAFGFLEVGYEPQKAQLVALISISDPIYLREVIERVRDLFDVRLNPHSHIDDLSVEDPVAACYRDELGLRIPGAWDCFDTAITIILGQLVSIEQASFKIQKLVEQFGEKIAQPLFAGCTHRFPTAHALAEASLKDVGITKVREQAIQELSRRVASKEIQLTRFVDIEKTKAQLLAIRGIGPWTVELIAMRCLGDTNAFPASDLIIKRALNFHQQEKGDWSPWNAYIALALWKKYAETLSKKKKK